MKFWTKVIVPVLLFILCALVTAESLAISQEEVQKIEDAVPAKATAVPKQPRRLLVFNLCNGFKHSSILDSRYSILVIGEWLQRLSGDQEIGVQDNRNQD